MTPITGSSTEAILFVTRCCSLLLPWLSYGFLRTAGCTPILSLFGFLLCITEPLLLSLGLQGLSESPALCWLAAACWLSYSRRHFLAGLLFGACLASRPSYAPILLPLITLLIYYRPSCRQGLMVGITFIALVSLGFVLIHDGIGFFTEGFRFVDGHFSLWGNSLLTNTQQRSWYQVVANYYGNGIIVLISFSSVVLTALFLLLLRRQDSIGNSIKTAGSLGDDLAIESSAREFRDVIRISSLKDSNQDLLLTTMLLVSGLTWTLLAQNPENLRHLAPMIWAFIILLCLLLKRANQSVQYFFSIALIVAGLWHMQQKLNWSSSLPAMHQAINWLSERQPKILVSNHGLELLRQNLPEFSVADAYYPGTAKRIVDRGGWQLSSSPLKQSYLQLETSFIARSPADNPLWLYRQR